MSPIPSIDNPPPEDDADDLPPRPPAKLVVLDKPTVLDPELSKNSDLAQDYIYARNLNHTLLQLVGDQLAGAATMAAETEHPRAYGVFNELAGTMRELIKDMLDLQKVFKDVKRDDKVLDVPAAPAAGIGTQNNFFNGSTADVVRLMEQHQLPAILDIGEAEVDEVTVKNEKKAEDGQGG